MTKNQLPKNCSFRLRKYLMLNQQKRICNTLDNLGQKSKEIRNAIDFATNFHKGNRCISEDYQQKRICDKIQILRSHNKTEHVMHYSVQRKIKFIAIKVKQLCLLFHF